MEHRRVAFVTGASRGIGRACARHLARSGFDVIAAARTVREGDAHGGLPGSLEAVADDVRAAGRDVLECRVDLLDQRSCAQAVEDGLARFGRIDVLVNSGLLAEGGMRSFEDTPIDHFERAFAANVLAPLQLVKLVLPSMRAQGGGIVVDISSGAGANETRDLPGAGGWPLAYSITKAAFNRAGAGLAKELRRDGIAVVNLEPGVVATERMVLVTSRLGLDATASGVSVDVPGSVCAFIATHATPMAFSGRTVDAPQFAAWCGLVDGESLPFPYGPSAWGAPPAVAVAGGVTGVESGFSLPPLDA
jgi:NAD(P)-dependent dehydrogenase (short-subunit alcohol dehydrogenase family)